MHAQGWKQYALGAGSMVVMVIAFLLASGWGSAAAAPGNPVAGKRVWETAQPPCQICHTLQAVYAYGTTGPNLDKVKPSVATAIKFITNGSRPSARWPISMQTFGGVLTKQQIRDVAAFIYQATHK
jgi:mono/diheme cytochrome c family protein